MVIVSKDNDLVNWDRITCINVDSGKTIDGKYQLVAFNAHEKISLGTYDTIQDAEKARDRIKYQLDPTHAPITVS